MAKKKEIVLPDVKDVTVSLDAFLAQAAELKAKFDWSPEKLDAMLVHVDEKDVVAGAKKTCSSIRTKITAEHKEVKAPYLVITKAIDAAKTEAINTMKAIEKPIDEAIARRKKADEVDKDAEIAALKAKLAKAEGAAESDGIKIAELEEKHVHFTLSATQANALKNIIGPAALKDILYDKDGNRYVLSLSVSRKELVEE